MEYIDLHAIPTEIHTKTELTMLAKERLLPNLGALAKKKKVELNDLTGEIALNPKREYAC